VDHGVTGYRCREMAEFVTALDHIEKIDPAKCRDWAIQKYSDDVIHDMFNCYLKRVIESNFYRTIT
jgi:hypothetical protein